MSSFSFAFGDTEEPQETKALQQPNRLSAHKLELNPCSYECYGETAFHCAGISLKKRTQQDINYCIAQLDDLSDKPSLMVSQMASQSDLSPGVYEGERESYIGGIKTWECSLDLVEYLNRFPELVGGKSVCELGCGSGLPAIMALLLGAERVAFQDYNQDVLTLVTAPNVLLNTLNVDMDIDGSGDVLVQEADYVNSFSRIQMYAGDWSFCHFVMQEKYDVILTSETIYASENIKYLLELIKHLLTPAGIVLVAAKHTYFGCSGSLSSFKLEAEESGFKLETALIHDQGVRREIVRMSQ